ncbi:MAG TPA: hypothetical protein PKV16_09155 [Caldisericia bacterium]|mgnify:CR=1 FL=1|nr:hypothetical protein [Caldisericia bacterium]HPF49897.1 hypothetical protein [Caldisericia bacterium]HPI84700.1 hypothetical protein [Caldisericia bacterium]HPQ93928.1 hypothetical protein [Caldisericia bacterium]HRV75730.1 hypothetical protein [Caldisericia bacterium]
MWGWFEKQKYKVDQPQNHYPFTTAPRELLRSTALNPHLPTSSDVDVYFNSMLDWTNPTLADYVRRQKWNPYKENRGTNTTQTLNSLKTNPLSTLSRDYNPTVALVYDESTDYTYDKENRLTHVDLPDGTDVDFSYDGLGRRLTKVITDGTDITTIKYHYVGGQITTIEIDAEDDEVAYRDETLHIHLGPNSYPISFEWVRYDYAEETTLDDTYYYHYDLHGNVLKVTDDSEVTKITYLYDVLGEITSETNNDNIPNFFTYRGATQTLTDSELDLYFGGGFYRPDLGVTLSVGETATNQTSSSVIGDMAKIQLSNIQMAIHSVVAAADELIPVEEMSYVAKGAAPPAKDVQIEQEQIGPSESAIDFPPPPSIDPSSVSPVEQDPNDRFKMDTKKFASNEKYDVKAESCKNSTRDKKSGADENLLVYVDTDGDLIPDTWMPIGQANIFWMPSGVAGQSNGNSGTSVVQQRDQELSIQSESKINAGTSRTGTGNTPFYSAFWINVLALNPEQRKSAYSLGLSVLLSLEAYLDANNLTPTRNTFMASMVAAGIATHLGFGKDYAMGVAVKLAMGLSHTFMLKDGNLCSVWIDEKTGMLIIQITVFVKDKHGNIIDVKGGSPPPVILPIIDPIFGPPGDRVSPTSRSNPMLN